MSILNESIVLQFIKKATENQKAKTKGVLGKIALQKCMYFFNLTNDHFYFKWADYGPFSKELQNIAHDLIVFKKIDVEKRETKKIGATMQILTLTKDTKIHDDLPNDIEKEIDKIILFATGFGPRQLELLASVHYWAKKQQEIEYEYTVDYIHEALTDLKPDAGFKKDDVEWAIEKLEDNGFLAKNDDNSQN